MLLTGVTETTKENLQLGAGILTTEYNPNGTIDKSKIIGATRGGSTFTAVPTKRNIEADGLPANTKGFVVIDEWVVTLNTTLIEFKFEALQLALGGGAIIKDDAISANHDVLDENYQDVYWIGNKSDGSKIAIQIKNALADGGLNITISDKGEGTYTLNIIGHYDINNLDEAPFKIFKEQPMTETSITSNFEPTKEKL